MARISTANPGKIGIGLSELVSALSYAFDISEGHPTGHCIRACWIGMHIGREIGLPKQELSNLYHTLLLKNVGCSSNAARICSLYTADDIALKHDFHLVNDSLPQILRFVLSRTGMKAKPAGRFRALLNIAMDGGNIANELFQARCQAGAEIIRQMRFSEAVAQVADAESPFTKGHSERVALFTDMIAERMGFDDLHRQRLKRAALLHDIGKLGVSNQILDKPDRLGEAEWAAVCHHPAPGEIILPRISGTGCR